MPPPTVQRRVSAEQLATVGALLLLIALPLGALVAYKLTGPSPAPESQRMGLAAGILALASLGAIALLAWGFRRALPPRRLEFWLPVTAIGVVAILGFGVAEVTLRIIAKPDVLGVRIGGTRLIPFDWKRMSDTSKALLASRQPGRSLFFAEDTLLGWTVAPNRESPDGKYTSGSAGVRTATRGERVDTIPGQVALFGDSFVFSSDVGFDQSLAHFLSPLLPATSVINLAVEGYGVDQTYLRFIRDGRAWRPRVAIAGFIQDDFYRAMSVYPFARGWVFPFSRPRFSLEGSKLVLRNVPPLSPESIFARQAVDELPFLDHDRFFDPAEWRRHPLFASYLVRLAASAFPRRAAPNARTSDSATVALSVTILKAFVDSARSSGIVPVLLYIPAKGDFTDPASLYMKQRIADGLRAHGLSFHDVTECLTKQVPWSGLFLEGRGHYGGPGNRALANCVAPLIMPHLAATPSGRKQLD